MSSIISQVKFIEMSDEMPNKEQACGRTGDHKTHINVDYTKRYVI